MDPLSLAAGAGILVAGWLVGHLTGRRAERRRRDAPQPPVCGCTHHLAAHDPETLKCSALVEVDRYGKGGNWTGKDWKSCACRKYVGPMPTDTLETLLRMPLQLPKGSDQ